MLGLHESTYASPVVQKRPLPRRNQGGSQLSSALPASERVASNVSSPPCNRVTNAPEPSRSSHPTTRPDRQKINSPMRVPGQGNDPQRANVPPRQRSAEHQTRTAPRTDLHPQVREQFGWGSHIFDKPVIVSQPPLPPDYVIPRAPRLSEVIADEKANTPKGWRDLSTPPVRSSSSSRDKEIEDWIEDVEKASDEAHRPMLSNNFHRPNSTRVIIPPRPAQAQNSNRVEDAVLDWNVEPLTGAADRSIAKAVPDEPIFCSDREALEVYDREYAMKVQEAWNSGEAVQNEDGPSESSAKPEEKVSAPVVDKSKKQLEPLGLAGASVPNSRSRRKPLIKASITTAQGPKVLKVWPEDDYRKVVREFCDNYGFGNHADLVWRKLEGAIQKAVKEREPAAGVH